MPGMREQGSRTAQYTALARMLETIRPRPRLFEDPYAARFLGLQRLTPLAGLAPVCRAIERGIDRRYPTGQRGNAVIRTRVIDDWTVEALADGAEQVVLLGAGLDSRAYRMPAMSRVPVFEVDHPATQAAKQVRVHRHVPAAQRGHVRFVAVDLRQDHLDPALRAAGFQTAPTVVIWEGVTPYLDAAAVDATMDWFAGNTASGSRLIFTYLDLHGDAAGGVSDVAALFSDVGEPMTFGLRPDELDGYLTGHDLTLIRSMSSVDAARHPLHPIGRHDLVGTVSHIAVAGRP